MSMQKIASLTGAGLILLSVLVAGCGSAEDPETPAPAAASQSLETAKLAPCATPKKVPARVASIKTVAGGLTSASVLDCESCSDLLFDVADNVCGANGQCPLPGYYCDQKCGMEGCDFAYGEIRFECGPC